MKIADVDDLHPFLVDEFEDTAIMSVAPFGSFARGNVEHSPDGTIHSGLDLLAVVPGVREVPAARARLLSGLSRVEQRFQVACIAYVALAEALLAAPDVVYAASLSRRSFVCDPLGLGDRLRAVPPRSAAQILPWRVQPVTYYLAKSGSSEPARNVRKAVRWLLAAGADDATLDADQDPALLRTRCVAALTGLMHRLRIDPLPSSRAFLEQEAAGTAGAATFTLVRDLVFREGLGLPYTLSAVATH